MPKRPIDGRIAAILLTCALSLGASGCNDKKVRAAAPVAAAPTPASTERPMTVAPDTDASPPAEVVGYASGFAGASHATACCGNCDAPEASGAHGVLLRPPRKRNSLLIRPLRKFLPNSRRPIRPPTSARRVKIRSRRKRISNKPVGSNSTPLSRTSSVRFGASYLNRETPARTVTGSRAQNLAQKARLLSDELIGSF